MKPGTATYILESQPNALEQITTILAQHTGIADLHIISHGSPGNLYLGTTELNSKNLEQLSPQLKQWGKALTENADILLYGCEVAKGETGQNFLKRLSEITGANIAASATPTGSAELGGDWNLEVQTGPIAAAIPFNAKALKTYSGVLGLAPKVTAVTATTADGSYGVGSTIAITATFDAAVTVTGTPRLQLETGTTDQFATYASGSGGTALTFNYVVQTGDSAADLEYLATNALTLDGGTIKDNLAADAVLTLPALATDNSLGGSKAIVVDTVAPTAKLGIIPNPNIITSPGTSKSLTVTFSDNNAVDVSSLDSYDIFINGPGGDIAAQFVSVDTNSNGTPRTATYSFTTPFTLGSTIYTVKLEGSQVKDSLGNFAVAGSLGTFNLTGPIPPTPVTPTPTPVTPTPTPTANPNQAPIVYNPVWTQSRARGWSSNTTFEFASDTFIDPNPGDTITYTVTAIDNNSVTEGEDYIWKNGENGGLYKQKTNNASVTTIPEIFDGPNASLKFDPTTRTLSQVPGKNLSLPQWVEVKGTDNNGKSVSELLKLVGSNRTGFVIDDYIAGANVFFDANKNGIADPNEPKGTTDGKGAFAFDIPFSTFDTNKNGKLDPNEGNLVAFGGTDIGTNLPLETPLKATPDAEIITLLTSIVAELADRGLTVNEANAKVTSAFGIPSDIPLNYVDPIAATQGGQPSAKAALTTMLVAQNSITQTAGLIEGASNLTVGDAVKQIVSTIADRIQTGTLDFSKSEQVGALIVQVGDRVKAIDPNFKAQNVSDAKTELAKVIAASNQRVVDAIATNTDPTQLQKQVAVIQKVALGETTQDFKAFGAGQKT
ncbi:MAG: DUF4347 domain-containing protein, partial [Tychonema bourrellyi B0820]|nr:DUF4347 domain-containing protein [Tychonema bourrellyi B0820]